MADVDKIVSEAEHRHDLKEWWKASSLQLKDFSFVALLLLFGISPLIVAAVKKIANLII